MCKWKLKPCDVAEGFSHYVIYTHIKTLLNPCTISYIMVLYHCCVINLILTPPVSVDPKTRVKREMTPD